MRILLKCPTRSRPQKVAKTLETYVRMANHPELMGVLVSADVDDDTMTNDNAKSGINQAIRICAWKRIQFGGNKTKIEACNANMDIVDYPWDIVVLVSDDMIPQIKGYDDVIRNHMKARFPDTDGILWFNDGFQGEKLNTLCVFGRKMYESLGYIYHPSYKSLFCDTELTDLCRSSLASKTMYVPYCIIRHEHPGTGFGQNMDALYTRNQGYWNDDMYNYIARKTYDYDWSVLIPTIPGREGSLQRLIDSLHEKTRRICPSLRMEIRIGFDNREQSVGTKRDALLQSARGKYLAFIDDDDDITDAYIEDLWKTVEGNYSVMRLRGQIQQYTFTHSLANKLTDNMARANEFLRPPNHLNPMMSDVAKLVRFKDAIRGEDLDWTIRMARMGFLTGEYTSDPSRIHYIYNMGDRKVDPASLEFQKNTSYDIMLKMVWTPDGPALPPPVEKDRIPVLRLGSKGFVSR